MDSAGPSVASVSASTAPQKSPAWFDSSVVRAAILVVLSLALLVGCYHSGFTTYDDSMHVSRNEQITQLSPTELFTPVAVSTYFPVTLLSYQFDRTIFFQWLGWQNWAPGVRFMTWVYHVAAALILWRYLLRLGIARNAAFFAALAFAVHPLATETVCWTSERKNALAAMFGFAALWSYSAGARRWWKLPLICLFFSASLLSKPSALGFVPVFLFLELFFGPDGKITSQARAPLPARWLNLVMLMTPIVILAGVALRLNLSGHAATIVEPPGGTIFTAILTDLEIGARYLLNLLAPFWLSAVYFVDPIRGLGNVRVAMFGALLTVVIAVSIWVAPNRKLTIFLWLWLIGALGPSLNLVAIPHYMQDRYIYLSTPAFFLILWQIGEGLAKRFNIAPGVRVGAAAYIGVLVVLSIQRSFVWDSAFSIFMDAVEKQPKAAYARFGLGMAWGQAAEMAYKQTGDLQRMNEYRNHWMDEWRAAIDDCPDVTRFSFYSDLALNVGEHFNAHGDLELAEKYWQKAAFPPPGVPEQAPSRARALGWLASLRLSQADVQQAFELAVQARDMYAGPQTVLIHARAAIALAKEKAAAGDRDGATALLKESRNELKLIPDSSGISKAAKDLLATIPDQ